MIRGEREIALTTPVSLTAFQPSLGRIVSLTVPGISCLATIILSIRRAHSSHHLTCFRPFAVSPTRPFAHSPQRVLSFDFRACSVDQ